jgi:hypothetical protein
MPRGILKNSESLNTGESLETAQGNHFFVLQGDGNLVLYYREGGRQRATWASNTAGVATNRLVMQEDGNLVLYGPPPGRSGNGDVWDSGTVGQGSSCWFQVQDDGNAVIYSDASGSPVAKWATGTDGFYHPIIFDLARFIPGDFVVDGIKQHLFFTKTDTFLVDGNGRLSRATGSLTSKNPNCDPTPDGCTKAPDFNFKDACDRHDISYAKGGSEADRLNADRQLGNDIKAAGHEFLGQIYEKIVNAFGAGHFCYRDAEGKPIERPDRDGGGNGGGGSGGGSRRDDLDRTHKLREIVIS